MGDEIIRMSATALLAAYRTKALSPVEAVEAVLARIEARDGALNALCLVDAEAALAAARESEARWARGEPAGRLDGVPALVKDLLLTRGWPTRRGSKTIDPRGPWDDDAPAVARLREHGAVLVGKTTTPEFGWKGVTDSPLTGISRNPWDTARTPGGSSGGSAAAVAAGMAPLALGTDGGGSIRIPAGFCGVFGLKPSFGRVPAWPLSPFGTVAHVGPMTRSVADAALMLTVIAEPDARDWYALPHDGADYMHRLEAGVNGRRVAFAPAPFGAWVDPEVAELVGAAAQTFAALGARVEEADPGIESPADLFGAIWATGAHYMISRMPTAAKALLDPGLLEIADLGATFDRDAYIDAQLRRADLGARMRLFMRDYDFLLTPTLPVTAFEAGKTTPDEPRLTGDKWTRWTPFSYPFNLTQQPAASIPCGFTAAGLPAGLQIVGRMFDDAGVLSAARAYEAASGWSGRRPPG